MPANIIEYKNIRFQYVTMLKKELYMKNDMSVSGGSAIGVAALALGSLVAGYVVGKFISIFL